MKHIKLYEQFINEDFAKQAAENRANFPELIKSKINKNVKLVSPKERSSFAIDTRVNAIKYFKEKYDGIFQHRGSEVKYRKTMYNGAEFYSIESGTGASAAIHLVSTNKGPGFLVTIQQKPLKQIFKEDEYDKAIEKIETYLITNKRK